MWTVGVVMRLRATDGTGRVVMGNDGGRADDGEQSVN